jgi:hypothetical protein
VVVKRQGAKWFRPICQVLMDGTRSNNSTVYLKSTFLTFERLHIFNENSRNHIPSQDSVYLKSTFLTSERLHVFYENS